MTQLGHILAEKQHRAWAKEGGMLFLIIGIVMVLMKLGHLAPVSTWDWFWISIPFLLAVCWFEIVEPLLGWDSKRELDKQLALHRKIQDKAKKKEPSSRKNSHKTS